MRFAYSLVQPVNVLTGEDLSGSLMAQWSYLPFQTERCFLGKSIQFLVKTVSILREILLLLRYLKRSFDLA